MTTRKKKSKARTREEIAQEHDALMLEIGRKEYTRRVLDAQIGQLAQRALELNNEAQAAGGGK